jgi:biopolymer transport protein ExbB
MALRVARIALAFLLLAAGPALAQEQTPAQPAPQVETQPAPPAAAPTQAQTPTETPTVDIVQTGPSTLPHDLSPWNMFMNADIIVKAVMLGLAFASLVTWTVWLAKSLELAGASLRVQKAMRTIVESRTLDEALKRIGRGGGAAGLLAQAAKQEVAMSEAALEYVDGSGLKERVASRLSRIEAQASRRMTRGTGLLATIGSTAPFVGLFGTVWGIMNSFISISESQTTNLAVVAPGIAEALLATAIGLVAAIPAVVIYNVFARAITGYKQLLADASAGVERLVSRDLDYRPVPPLALAAE